MTTLRTYLPQDRLHALARGEALPDRTSGSALFADISGFTQLTENLTHELGARRGIEELTQRINAIYDVLITGIEKYGGSVISFAGDAITCWFDGDNGQQAVAAALALQDAMSAFPELGLKVVVTRGAARRFVAGNPKIQLLDALAGAAIARLATAEHLANKGEVLIDAATAESLAAAALMHEWRAADAERGERFAVVQSLTHAQPALYVNAADNEALITDEQLRPWILPAVFEREQNGQGSFLAEFRPCVVLFICFIGIDYDADDAQMQLDLFIQQLQSVASRYEGVLLQLMIGDKGSYVYVNFGALNAHEDDARRAVKTALELKNLSDLQLQIGIAQGVMRVGAYGGQTRRAYGALSDEVNLAARLMQNAAPNEILLDSHVQRAAGSHFVFEPRPSLTVKGKIEPLPVFAVTGERQRRAIRLQEPTYALPMVGRQVELQTINAKLDLALNGQAQIIGIVAEAGMGKSRLVAEVIRAARKKGFAGYGGACQSDAINTPYQAWKSVWSAFFDIDPSAPLKKQLRLLEGEIEDRAPERVQALPLLGQVLDLPLPIPDNDFTKTLEPKFRQSMLHALLEDCLKATAKDEPLLIVIEDLHWVDALSHDLLEELARATAAFPICFVLAYRPPQTERGRLITPRLEVFPHFTKIELSELNAQECEQAIRAKLAQLYPARGGAVPLALVKKLMARAQGNPFYLEELLNFLRDRGLDPRDPAALKKIELPDSLHTLILSRIDQLSEREKTTLRVASIIGRLFRASWLTGYYPALGELPQVKADLDELHSHDITSLDTPEPELAYLFKHIVTREVAYESMTFAMRAQLHEQLAKFIETLDADHYLEALAFHYSLSANTAKQCEYLQKAGDKAKAAYAHETALDYYHRLLPLLSDPQAQMELHLKLFDSNDGLGNIPASRAALDEALRLAATPADRAAVLVRLGDMNNSALGNYAEAHAILTEALTLARAGTDQHLLARALSDIAYVNINMGNFDAAHPYINECLTLSRSIGDTPLILAALSLSGMDSTDLAEQERFWKEAHALALATGERGWVSTQLENLGCLAYDRGDWTEARALMQQALTLVRELGARIDIAVLLINLASIDIPLRDYPAARAELRDGLALARELGASPPVMFGVWVFADLLAAQGDASRALALLGLCQRHPVFSYEDRRLTDIMLARWNLDAATVEAGLAQGAALDFDATVEEIARELA